MTLSPGEGVPGIVDQQSRTPESLARSCANSPRAVDDTKLAMARDALRMVSPQHGRVFIEPGCSKARLRDALERLLLTPGDHSVVGAQEIAKGLPAEVAREQIPKCRPGDVVIEALVDRGSGTSCRMHDMADLEGLNVSGVEVAATAFVEAAQARSPALWFEPAMVCIAHPIQDRTDDELRALAQAAIDSIIAGWTTHAQPVAGACGAPGGFDSRCL